MVLMPKGMGRSARLIEKREDYILVGVPTRSLE